MERILLVLGDITRLKVDAVVNSANRSLAGGGGVDRAIHMAAGHDLLLECLTLGGGEPGNAKVTDAYEMPARRIIHAVAPAWLGGAMGEVEILEKAYTSALDIAQKEGLQSVAFPCLGRGIRRFPVDEAADAALSAILRHPYPGRIVLCCATREDFDAYLRRLEHMAPEAPQPVPHKD